MGSPQPAGATIAMVAAGGAAIGGVVLSAQADRARRSLGWIAQALATAALGIGLVASLAAGPAAGGGGTG